MYAHVYHARWAMVWIALWLSQSWVAGKPLDTASAAEAPAEPAVSQQDAIRQELTNQAYQLVVAIDKGVIIASVEDRVAGDMVADGFIVYRATKQADNQSEPHEGLQNPLLSVDDDKLIIHGPLAGVAIEHIFTLPTNRPVIEEQIVVRNDTGEPVALTDFEVGLTRHVADGAGNIPPAIAKDHVVAVPFQHRATDPEGFFHDFSIADLVTKPGQVCLMNKDMEVVNSASRHRCSEAWAWTHSRHTLGIFSFNQENMVFSVISKIARAEGTLLCFGGAVMIESELAALGRMAPGASVDLGLIRYQTIPGGYTEAMYAYRKMLDEKGCRFPKDTTCLWQL